MGLETASVKARGAERILLSPAVLFTLCVLLTASATAAVSYFEVRETQQDRFEEAVLRARQRIEERMASYLALLRGARGLFSQRGVVSPEEFHIYVTQIGLPIHYPGTLGLAYSHRFGDVSVEEANAIAHARGWPGVRIWPDHPRDEVHAIVLIEPLDERNEAALGYDMFTQATRRDAMERARDTGHIAVSGRVRLVQEIEGQPQAGFVVYAPVYEDGTNPSTAEQRRAHLQGFAYMPLRAGDLFEGVFAAGGLPLSFEVYDAPSADEGSLLYSTEGSTRAEPESVVTQHLPVGGRVWTLRFARPPSGAPTFPIAVGVALLGLLLSGIVLAVSRIREETRERAAHAVSAAAESQELLRLSETFLGILGHDLRSPLNAITMGAQLLKEEHAGGPETARTLDRILSSSQRMARMIDRTLDLTRARLGGGIPVTTAPADLEAIASDVVDEIRHQHPDQVIELRTRGSSRGVWDGERLAQVFSNLVGNAVRHADGQPVQVQLSGPPSGTGTGTVVATVHNAGIIPASLLPVVFEPFRRGDQHHGSGGLGLGLYITQSVVHAHGGTIDVVSDARRGTTFTIRLPRRPGEPLDSEPAKMSAPRASRTSAPA